LKILFLHGWHSVPGGVKPTYLIDHGHEVINPVLDDDDFDTAVATGVIPFSDSEELVARSGLPPETLIEIGSDHRLADAASLSVMLWVCNLFASGEEFPGTDGNSTSFVDASSQEEGSYVCDACGEEIIIPLDLTEGTSQTYVEDCPVCCRANTIHVQVDEEGNAQVWAEPEQDGQ